MAALHEITFCGEAPLILIQEPNWESRVLASICLFFCFFYLYKVKNIKWHSLVFVIVDHKTDIEDHRGVLYLHVWYVHTSLVDNYGNWAPRQGHLEVKYTTLAYRKAIWKEIIHPLLKHSATQSTVNCSPPGVSDRHTVPRVALPH